MGTKTNQTVRASRYDVPVIMQWFGSHHHKVGAHI